MKKLIQSHAQNNSRLKDLSVAKAILKLIPSYTLDEDDVLLCEQYSIPYQLVYSTHKELANTEALISDYLDLITDAKHLRINWDTSNFNPEGLRAAIENYHNNEDDAELATHYHNEMKSNLWAYYSNLGVL